MKRGLITLFLLVLLVSPLVLTEEKNSSEVIDFFQTNVTTPSFNFLFLTKIPSYTFDMTWVSLILHIIATVILFVGALEILSYTALETNWTKALIAGAIVAVLIIFGAIQAIISVFLNLLVNFKLIAWGIVALIIAALLIKPIMNAMKKRKRLDKAEELGTTAGAALKGLKKTTEAAEESSE